MWCGVVLPQRLASRCTISRCPSVLRPAGLTSCSQGEALVWGVGRLALCVPKAECGCWVSQEKAVACFLVQWSGSLPPPTHTRTPHPVFCSWQPPALARCGVWRRQCVAGHQRRVLRDSPEAARGPPMHLRCMRHQCAGSMRTPSLSPPPPPIHQLNPTQISHPTPIRNNAPLHTHSHILLPTPVPPFVRLHVFDPAVGHLGNCVTIPFRKPVCRLRTTLRAEESWHPSHPAPTRGAHIRYESCSICSHRTVTPYHDIASHRVSRLTRPRLPPRVSQSQHRHPPHPLRP
jgi:hypothetical protein